MAESPQEPADKGRVVAEVKDLPGCDVSVILPVYNGEKWLEESLQSVFDQDFEGSLEVSIFNDASTDNTENILREWKIKLENKGIKVTLAQQSQSQHQQPRGVGYAKNAAARESRGRYLCFLDADDVMMKERISSQYATAVVNEDALIGCQFYRAPDGSTERYTRWANGLSPGQLYSQVYTSHGPTVIMPTWFCSRNVFQKVGGFSEAGRGTPEDLIFFYQHLKNGGKVVRVERVLLMYRYHLEATTFSVTEDTIWNLRMKVFQEEILPMWHTFTIWNGGKQGRHFYRSLSHVNQTKVIAFCDVDEKKLSKGFYTYEESTAKLKPKVPIIHFSQVVPPIVICVKQDLTEGSFEENLSSLHLTEGLDYFFFS